MVVVNIAELKNRLSAYLRRVRAGEEILIRDRNLPIARLVPLPAEDYESERLALIAEGKLIPGKKKLDAKAFWKLAGEHRVPKEVVEAGIRAVIEDRGRDL